MRFPKIEHGESLKHRLIFLLIRIGSGFRASDVLRTLFYRGQFFGTHHNLHTRGAMRGPSAWSVADRELFATYVSHLNQCRF